MRCACSFAHTKTRLEATLPFRTLEMQLCCNSLCTRTCYKRWHASISQGSCMCTSYTSVTYAHAHMHAMHNVHMRVPYGTESLPKTSLADAALHGCSLTRRSNMAYVGVQRNSRLRAASIRIHQLRPPIPRTRKPGRVFARRRRKNGNWAVKRSNLAKKWPSVQHRPSAPSGLVMRNHPFQATIPSTIKIGIQAVIG